MKLSHAVKLTLGCAGLGPNPGKVLFSGKLKGPEDA